MHPLTLVPVTVYVIVPARGVKGTPSVTPLSHTYGTDVVTFKVMAVPSQIVWSSPASIVGSGSTIISRVVIEAHCPTFGVKVYVVVPAVLVETAGDQVPVIAFVDVVGRTGAASP